MQADTWFDLASLTKVLFTAPRILEHHVNGVIDLDAPLTSVLPDFRQYDGGCWERKVTFRQCLGHLTRFPAVEPLYTYGQDAQLLRAFILQREWRPGPPVYSDINFILLGLVLERIEGCTLREMNPGKNFAFSATPGLSAATESCTWRHKILCGDVHDDNCHALLGAGHAGLFGTAYAVLDYAQGLLSQSLHPMAVHELIQTPLSPTHTHGWQRAHDDWSGGNSCTDKTIGHTGFTGTGIWIDFGYKRAWTLLTNRIHPSRHTKSGIDELRRAVADAICRG
ncbi:MAG: CubicO group peptidase (beta-lactamase class C family) [Pseudomonadales bacterium]|jgi:CubicO group peptidase (beta-lactamase class C family)